MSRTRSPYSLRAFHKRYGDLPDPIPLPELDGLDVAPILPGEVPPPPDDDGAMACRDLDGRPIGGTVFEQLVRFNILRSRPGAKIRARPFYRAGTRLLVSTAYIGWPVGWWAGGLVTVWETMVFHGGDGRRIGSGGETWNYATRAAARAGHVQVVTAIREAQRARRAARAHVR